MSKKAKILILIIAVLIIFSLNFFQKEVRGFFYQISAPFQKVLWRVGDKTSDFFQALVFVKNLKKENEELNNENQKLLSQLVGLEDIKKENEILKQALEIELEKEFELKAGYLISKDVSGDFIVLDKGQNDGLKIGMPVITQEKALCGKIDEVYDNFSKVVLISNKKSTFDAKILKDEKEISGLVKGRGNLKLYLDMIPQEEKIEQGDLIITSLLGGVFPENLLVGKVSKIEASAQKPFQKAEISLFCNIKEAKILFIINEVRPR